MAYSSAFLRKFSAEHITPVWVLDAVRIPGDPRPGGLWRLATPGVGSLDGVITGVSVAPSSLSVPAWDTSVGVIEVTISGDMRGVIGEMARGQAVTLRAGLAGEPESAWQLIAVGILHQIERTGIGSEYRLTIRDLGALLAGRLTRSGSPGLFADLSATTLTAHYNPGDTTISVASTSGFERETGGSYCLRITSNAGPAFYVTATGTSGGTSFTGVSATAILGTTAAAANSGRACEEVAYIYDHPVRVAAKILCSTGAGSNGPYDTLPSSWGYGLPNWLIDRADIEATITATTPASVSTGWRIWSEIEQEDPEAWIRAWLSAGGFFPCGVQGLLSIRGAWVPYVRSSALQLVSLRGAAATISDGDISSPDSLGWAAWSDDAQEANSVRIRSATGSVTSTVEPYSTAPGIGRVDYDARLWLWDSETTWRQSIRDRVSPWHTRVPEVLRMTLQGLSWASLAVGDCVVITSGLLHGRTRTTDTGWRQQRALVSAVQVDWLGLAVSLELQIISDKTSDFG